MPLANSSRTRVGQHRRAAPMWPNHAESRLKSADSIVVEIDDRTIQVFHHVINSHEAWRNLRFRREQVGGIATPCREAC
jgi:hypothetical protein